MPVDILKDITNNEGNIKYNQLCYSFRHWFSCDTKEERMTWCEQLNESLRNLRAWHQDALRPLKKPNHTCN